jgi:hypothetical protein
MKSEKDWMAESDFHSLTEAEKIKSDKQRHSAAIKAGKNVVEKRTQEVNAMKKVANKKMPMKKQVPKKQSKRRK